MVFLAGCSKQPPPITVTEFMENPRLLEATMVRCGENRATLKYDADCVNARDAVNRLEARAAKTQRDEREAMSERKREALRRNQEAAVEARRRTFDEAQRQQAELLGVPADHPAIVTTDDSGNVIDPATVAASNAPVAELAPPEEEFVVVPDAEVAAVPAVIVTTDESGNVIDPTAVAESNVPLAEIAPEEIVEAPDAQSETAAPVGSDINSIREELQRRQDEPQ